MATFFTGSQQIATDGILFWVLQHTVQTPLLLRRNAGPTQNKGEKLKGWLGDYFGTTEQEEAAPLMGDGATMDLN